MRVAWILFAIGLLAALGRANEPESCLPKNQCVTARDVPVYCQDYVFSCGGKDAGWGSLHTEWREMDRDEWNQPILASVACVMDRFGQTVCANGFTSKDGSLQRAVELAAFCFNPPICMPTVTLPFTRPARPDGAVTLDKDSVVPTEIEVK